MRVGLLGFGRLGSAIAKGLKKRGYEVLVVTGHRSKERAVAEGFEIVDIEALNDTNLIISALESDVSKKVLPRLQTDVPVVSTAAKLSLEEMRKLVKCPYRAMLSITAEVNEGPVLIAEKGGCSDELVEKVMCDLGECEWSTEEELVKSIKVVGSGPALVAMFYLSLVEGLVGAGVEREKAERMARATIRASSEILLNTSYVWIIRSKVETPGGITVKMLSNLEERGVFGAITKEISGR